MFLERSYTLRSKRYSALGIVAAAVIELIENKYPGVKNVVS